MKICRWQKSDRYQYILPYYNFNKILDNNILNGSLVFSSKDNHLNNTNQLKSRIINDLTYKSTGFISRLGFVNDADIHFKNLILQETLNINQASIRNSQYI